MFSGGQGFPQSAHFIVASYVCSRAVGLLQLGLKPRSRLELHPIVEILIRCVTFYISTLLNKE